MKTLKILLTAAILISFLACKSGNSATVTRNQEAGDMFKKIPESIIENLPLNPAMEFARNMGIGINIGNTLDAIGTASWIAGETGWGNPPVTLELIQALKSYGYTTIRLPVTWAEYIGDAPDYLIQERRMSRVEEVVKWILDEGLYCILNLHHDGGESDRSWILDAANEPQETARKLAAVWMQIAQRFGGISQEKLIFESMNEVGFDKLWNRYGGEAGGKSEAFGILNMLNQTFVDTVRRTRGNENRFLLIAGYWTDIAQSCDPLFQMPRDTLGDRLMLSVHYYDPAVFTIADKPDNSWGFRNDWGTDNDYAELSQKFNMLRMSFLDKGIPVVMGEYGVTLRNKIDKDRITWMAAVKQSCLNFGICPVLWDTGGEISRNPPFTMRDSLKEVWTIIKK